MGRSTTRKPRAPRSSRTSRTRWTTRSTCTTTTTMSTSMCYYLCAYLPTILLPSKEKVITNQISSHFSIFLYVHLVILFSFLVAGTDKEDQSSEKYHHWKDIRLNFLIFRFNLSVKLCL